MIMIRLVYNKNLIYGENLDIKIIFYKNSLDVISKESLIIEIFRLCESSRKAKFICFLDSMNSKNFDFYYFDPNSNSYFRIRRTRLIYNNFGSGSGRDYISFYEGFYDEAFVNNLNFCDIEKDYFIEKASLNAKFFHFILFNQFLIDTSLEIDFDNIDFSLTPIILNNKN